MSRWVCYLLRIVHIIFVQKSADGMGFYLQMTIKGAFQFTSAGWTSFVHLPGITAIIVFVFCTACFLHIDVLMWHL